MNDHTQMAIDLLKLVDEKDAEIERLRAYIAEVAAWKEEGERLFGNSGMGIIGLAFSTGAWWADRPWRVREALGERNE